MLRRSISFHLKLFLNKNNIFRSIRFLKLVLMSIKVFDSRIRGFRIKFILFLRCFWFRVSFKKIRVLFGSNRWKLEIRIIVIIMRILILLFISRIKWMTHQRRSNNFKTFLISKIILLIKLILVVSS
jgi:hypothetical protein